MGSTLDLSDSKYERYIVLGRVLGDFSSLIQMLYDQQFGFKDALILNGDFLNTLEPQESASVCEFMKQASNCYAVQGLQEQRWLESLADDNRKGSVNYLLLNEFEEEYGEFIRELPLIIKLPGYYFSVYAGVQPQEGIHASDSDVFVKIGSYDINSRFYQFANPEKKSWYEFKIFEGSTPVKIVFAATPTDHVVVNAGYNVYRESVQDALKGLIITRDAEPIILESNYGN